jgi:dihydroxyacetone kinase
MAHALRRAIGGSSGPFYATALLRASRALGAHPVTAESWARGFVAAVSSIAELGGAKRGDRTMLDALEPACDAISPTSSFFSVISDEAGGPVRLIH